MSIAFKKRQKVIKRLRKEYLTEDINIVRSYAHNDNWCGVAARLALRDRGMA